MLWTKCFNVKCGIRQGCPISALIFILCVELLAIQIENDVNIKGIDIADQHLILSQFADDMAVFLKYVDSVPPLLRLLKRVETSSGLK